MKNYFAERSGNYDLKDDGFQVFDISDATKKIVEEIEDKFCTNLFPAKQLLRLISNDSKHEDVFRTKLGDIKQIQNLHKSHNAKFINKYLAELLGWNKFEVLNNQFFCKPPNYKMTSAHQDNAYFNSNKEVVTFWIPVQDVDIMNSCMFYVPKSHLNGVVEHNPIGTNIRTRTGSTGLSLYSDVHKNIEFVPIEMKKGEILVHDKNVMHFSSANQTDEYRMAFTAILKKIK